jgi:dTDP-4-amino-4,6-dideoxygalactose transaminase
MTYVATVNAFRRAGWAVTIVDTDVYGQMDHKKIDREQSVQATVAVGLYGQSINKHEYLNNNAVVIEDGAQHWLSDGCRRIGSVTAISFDPMKNFNSYSNGGAIVTDDINMLDFARSWRNNGKPNFQMIGTNSRMSEVDCAQLMIKAKYIDEWQRRRSKISGYWLDRLRGTAVRSLIDETNHRTHAVNKFVIDVNNRDILKRNLEIRRIETKILTWEPLHELPAYDEFPGPDVLSVASALSRRTLCLPVYPELTDLEVEYVIDSLLDCV